MNEQQRQDVLNHVLHNIAFIPVSAELYSELEDWARNSGGGTGAVAAIADHQLRFFLERMQEEHEPTNEGRSMYWRDPGSGKVVELPHGTELRTKYFGEWRVAVVNDGVIEWETRSFKSPSQACNALRGDTSNNAWREFEIKRPADTGFRGANRLR